MTRWWSVSKRDWQDIDKMHGAHIINCAKKLERNEYQLPDDDADPLATRPPTASEKADLAAALDAEMQKRHIGPYTPEDADEGLA